jgi:Protein of unknown function (DUF2721)
MTETHITAITHAIQLAIAPVFLLTAVGTIINALINRLARAVDRRRDVEQLLAMPEAPDQASLRFELGILSRRTVLIVRSIALAVFSALMVCILIAAAFAAAFVSVDLSRAVASLFVASMIALIACLVLFLREVFLAGISVHPDAWPIPLSRAEK